jgi:hypothetical protein
LELARAIGAAGRGAEALERLAVLIGERRTPNRVRAQAAEVAGDLVRADRSLASRSSLFDEKAGQGNAGAVLAKAAIAEAIGDTEHARSLLSGIGGPLAPVAFMKLGLISLGLKRDAEAVADFERAVHLDADGSMTDAVAFKATGPRAQLIALYSKTGRDLAAIRLAEGDGSVAERQGQRPLISTAVRNALNSPGSKVNVDTVVFEPSLDASSKLAGFRTLAELNAAAASRVQGDLLGALVESASRLGQYDRAIAVERLRAMDAKRAEEKAAIEKRLAELIAADQTRRQRLTQLVRINRSNATESIYTSRLGL